jgi:hypothetical protein
MGGWWAVAALAWTGARRADVPRTYALDGALCAALARPGGWLAWTAGDACADVRRAVRAGFDAWAHASPGVDLVETAGGANVTVSAAALPPRRLAEAAGGDLVLSTAACWHADPAFCGPVRAHAALVDAGVGVAWLAACAAVVALETPRAAPPRGAQRVAAWGIAVAAPLAYAGAVRPCTACADLGGAVAHEVGHLLGLGHADDASTAAHTCGCGARARAARAPCGGGALMDAVLVPTAPTGCLRADDADAVRTLYGGACADPVWCYEGSAGYARVAVALAYGHAAALLVVGARNACARRAARRRARGARREERREATLRV